MSWSLENAEACHREAPYTFYVPSRQLLGRLAAGDRVKLIFKLEDDSVLEFLEAGVPCAYERSRQSGKFEVVRDYDWDAYYSEE
ncbi:hypothetical protein N0M98_11945 [Paenibacillus doosanensis]|uniref:hypothetical protein n=1 Tax=Paenibacillus doosanensis TaxID=1229154 RepID=UPI0021801BDD|nr:hypothetical protein [Paenibacillus doosanensis]MCS7460854.1 hypothetical protein [Paenibacillus doosanensis]